MMKFNHVIRGTVTFEAFPDMFRKDKAPSTFLFKKIMIDSEVRL